MQLVANDLVSISARSRAIMNVSTCKNGWSITSRPLPGHHGRGVLRRAYQNYQRRLLAANALDFDDLILTAVPDAGLPGPS
jgi:superfamily I DNA/RNA helicase